MKKILWLALLVGTAGAQAPNPSIVSVTTAPSGSCSSGLPNQQVLTTGVQYSCQSGTWAALAGGGSGGGIPTTPTNALVKINGSNGAASSLTDNGTAVSTTEPFSANGITATATAGTAGIAVLVGGATAPTIPANEFGWLGFPSGSATSYFLQPSTTAPNGNYLQCGAPSGGVSACTWATPSGSSVTFPTGVLYGNNSTSAPTVATSSQILSGIGSAAITNTYIANPSTTVNGTTCTLGSTCTIAAGVTTPTTGDLLASTGTSGTVTTLHRVISMSGFGDSYMVGWGGVNNARDGFFGLIGKDTPVSTPVNWGVSGIVTQNINSLVFAHVTYDPSLPELFIDNGGINDARLDTCGASAGTNCQKNTQLTIESTVAWQSIPPAFRIFASAATRTGTWTANNASFPIGNSLTGSPLGTAEASSSTGATATFNIPSSASPVVGFTYLAAPANSSADAFSVSVDGTLQTDFCSGTTTFTSSSCGSQAFFNSAPISSFRQEFSVTPGTTHTLVVTALSVNPAFPVSVDWIPPSTTVNLNPVFYVNLPTNASAFGTTTTPFYNTAIATIINQEQADGLPIFLVDIVNGTPGANGTALYATSATTTCPASTATNHPNNCGHEAIEQTFLNTELTATSTTYPNGYQVAAFNSNANATLFTGQTFVPLSTNFGNTASGGLGSSPTWEQISMIPNLGLYPDPMLTFGDYSSSVKNGVFGYINTDASTGTPWAGASTTIIDAYNGWATFDQNTNGQPAASNFTAHGGVNLTNGNTAFNGVDERLNGTLASAATIAPVTEATTLTGATTITTITAPSGMSSTYGGCLKFITASGVTTTFGTGGNISNPTSVGTAGAVTGPALTIGCYAGSSWYLK